MTSQEGPFARRLRILLAEDEALIGLAAEAELTEHGHEVVLVGDGAAALEAEAAHGPFDLLVTDMQMPRLRGDALARRLRLARPDLPLVVMSANHVPETVAGLRALGGPIAILTKPVPFGDLSAAVARLAQGG
ncbi:response regulator [Belnapia sp. T6]|uniref:Response regulator n=1 Tax=Belnapia mucosa TaxID=2804532 RepID=A0ABS1VAQ0_9PROT|nr:response regulator [Belnapia mucosa]MBL6458747.1 response regulator [Belnapia mucosa]